MSVNKNSINMVTRMENIFRQRILEIYPNQNVLEKNRPILTNKIFLRLKAVSSASFFHRIFISSKVTKLKLIHKIYFLCPTFLKVFVSYKYSHSFQINEVSKKKDSLHSVLFFKHTKLFFINA